MPRGWESIFLLMLNYLKFITCTEKVEVPLRWSIQEGQCYMMVRNFYDYQFCEPRQTH